MAKSADTTARRADYKANLLRISLNKLVNRFDSLEATATSLSNALSALTKRVTALETAQSATTTKLTSLTGSVTSNTTTLTTNGNRIGAIEGGQYGARTEYGVIAFFSNGTRVATMWTPQVPNDGNNAAQASGTAVVTCTYVGGCPVTIKAAIRSSLGAQAAGTANAQAGVSMVAQAATGALVGGYITSPNPSYGGVAVKNIGKVALNSATPSNNTGTDITPVPQLLIALGQTYIIHANAQFFEFPVKP